MPTDTTGGSEAGAGGASAPAAAAIGTILQADEFFAKNPFPYFLMRGGGLIVRLNARFQELLGYSDDDIAGKQIEDFISRANVPELHGYHREKLRHRDRPFEYECNLMRKDAREIRAVISMNIVTQGGFALGSLRDVTEERRLSAEIQARNTELQETAARLRTAQEELQRTTQMATIGEVSGRVAHEILNPLTAVIARIHGLEGRDETVGELSGYVSSTAQSLKGGEAPSESSETLTAVHEALEEVRGQTKRDLNFVSSELDRIQRLVDDMRGATRAAVERQGFPLHELLRYCHEVMAEPLRRGECKSELTCPPELWVEVDRGEIIQVVTNLIRNAIEALNDSEGERSVRINVTNEAGVANIVIRDSGQGVSREIAPLIFEPNFTTKKTGTGFGLAIARRLIRAHSGDVTLDPPADGAGATFRITLPCTVRQQLSWEG